jgi:hypothetical protein
MRFIPTRDFTMTTLPQAVTAFHYENDRATHSPLIQQILGMKARRLLLLAVLSTVGLATASPAYAACSGSNGRGWGSGNGKGQFEMTAGDKSCNISFPGFIDDVKKTRTPATNVTITRKPKNGKIVVVAGKGLTYTPSAAFKGRDSFCTRNTTPKVKGKSLAGCITVSVK